MSIIIRKNSGIKAGEHVAELKDVRMIENADTKWGEIDVIYFYFSIKGFKVKERCPKHLTEDSKLGSCFIKGMLGGIPEKVDLEKLIDEKFKVEISKREDDAGKTWVNIERVIEPILDEEPEKEFDFNDF